jgi:hypothetical protein
MKIIKDTARKGLTIESAGQKIILTKAQTRLVGKAIGELLGEEVVKPIPGTDYIRKVQSICSSIGS